MKRAFKFSILIILVLGLMACDDFVKDAYRTLTVSYQAYNITLSGMGDLYKQGLIPDSVRDEAIKYGKPWQTAHNGAVKALAAYEASGGDANKQAYISASLEVAKALADLVTYCQPYLFKSGKEVPKL